MIQLGGNIELEGFEAIEPGKLVVVKKVVGSYTRQISDSNKGLQKLSLSIEKNNDAFDLKASAMIDGKETVSKISDKNLFYGIDKVLSDLVKAIK